MLGFSEIERTIGGYLKMIANNNPEHEALVYPFHDIRLTYKQFDEVTDKLAKGLLKMGIKKGDHIAMWAHNVPEWVLLLFASAKIGAVLVTVNTLYKSAELEYLLKQSDSTHLFMVKEYKNLNYVETVNTIAPELKDSVNGHLKSKNLPVLERVVYIGKDTPTGMMNFEEIYKLAEEVSDEELEAVASTLDTHDVINMQYTSGTTGFPKGVMLTHYNVLNNAYAIGQCMEFTEEDRLCIPVPFFHCFGLVLGILVCLSHGSTMVPVEYFNPFEVLKTVQDEKCTAVHGVPTMFISMLQVLEGYDFDVSTLRTGIMAGSNCPVETMKQVIEKMNMSEITIVYGQTEASPGMTQTRVNDPVEMRVQTVGKELPGVEIKIMNPETNTECPVGYQGELWGRGYNVMRGYYKMEDATKEAITEDGWLRTGDLAIKTEDGYYKITGRIKDMIIRGGENIYPREIEEHIYQHPEVEDVQVIGVPDEKYGEEAMAYVRPQSPELEPEHIQDFCKNRIADYKIPRYIEMIEEYPMTASGKIQKFKLREQAIEKYNFAEKKST
jgi:fatty-acyl-CoA synthase